MEITINAIRLYSLSYIISWFNIFTSSFFTALNNGFISALISFLRTLLFQVAMILILPAVWGINGIWLSVVVAELLAIVVSIICMLSVIMFNVLYTMLVHKIQTGYFIGDVPEGLYYLMAGIPTLITIVGIGIMFFIKK